MNGREQPEKLPPGICREKPANNLASLTVTPSLKALGDQVLSQWRHAKLFEPLTRYGIRPLDRMLLFGPPGNGKTVAAQWLASGIGCPLYRVRCEALVQSHLGQTTGNIGAVMTWLETQPRCVVLFDEVEQLFPKRTAQGSDCAREMGCAMTVFWQYLDRWQAQTLFVLATNLREQLDAALLSRIELKIEFGPPTAEQATAVITYWRERLHEYGSDQWGRELIEYLDQGGQFESFRQLWQRIQHFTRQHVVDSIGRNS